MGLEQPIVNKTEGHVDKIAPQAVDFNVIGACNLNCTWCWGPDHKVKHTLTAQHWIDAGKQLKTHGTENIIISGGEPLLRKDLLEIIAGLKALDLRVTLSTNGMFLLVGENKELLKYLDEIGLPLDGSTQNMNSAMRKGSQKSFELSLQAMRYVQEHHPNIKLTIRTVLSKKNLSDIIHIPKTLQENGIDVTKLRWKIYQIVPTGPRKHTVLEEGDEWLIENDEASRVVSEVQAAYPDIVVKFQDAQNKLNRYLHLDPTGDMFTLVGDGTEEKILGNLLDEKGDLINLDDTLIKLHSSEDRITDTSHGADNF
ncbi:MAG: radical SAM protein [Patescibacteria group bacterium]